MANTKNKTEYYFAEVKCSNCDYGYPYNEGFRIPKGIKEKEWSRMTECPRCGCKGVLYFYLCCSSDDPRK